MSTVALFKRLPTLRWQPLQNQQIVAPADQAKYPLLAEDFTFLERELMPYFRELDNEALQTQNQFRLEQVILIFGGVLASALGAFHVAFTDATWLGILEAAVAVILVAISQWARAFKAQETYFTQRLKAELLRAEYFLFLGHVGSYTDPQQRRQQFVRRVTEIITGEAK
jgi:hypothetical protein